MWQDTAQLLAAPCTCFERVEANAPAFNPNAHAAAPRLRAFTQQVLRMVPPPMAGVADRFLYIARRHARRMIVNGGELEQRLGALPAVRRVELEGLSLAA